MKDKVVISFADEAGSYKKAMKRLETSLQQVGYDGDFRGFTSYEQIGSPPHKGSDDAVPYAFKAYAFKKAIEEGYRRILWCDSPVYATKSIDPIFSHIASHGYLFLDNIGYSIGDYTSDACLKKFNMTRERSFKEKMIMACLMGVDVCDKLSVEFLLKYIKAADDGVSYHGAWTNHNQEVSMDMRVKGTRHDQSVASIIIAQMGLDITNAQQTYFAYDSHKGVLPIADTVCMWSGGMQ